MKSERISPFWVNGYQPFSALRITAMFMVMILHINLGLGIYEWKETGIKPLSILSIQFFELFSIGSVNAFVLISGWYGLKPSIKRLSSFIFQCLFLHGAFLL